MRNLNQFMISVKNVDVAPGLQHLLKLDTVPEDGCFFGFVELILLCCCPGDYVSTSTCYLYVGCFLLFFSQLSSAACTSYIKAALLF
ncbi:hypothetical protein HanPSC8_Chr11g0454111 [Helianthus annuus]|nr:hypothetical protein HanPSC8_Chr11g0454111 [Helianthus annuus]